MFDGFGNKISVGEGSKESVLSGKKWLPIGDSITTQLSYRGFVSYGPGMTEIGGGYADGRQAGYTSGAGYCALEKLGAIAEGTPDVISIALGTNDYGNGCPLGSIEDDPTAQSAQSWTFYGCYKKLISQLYQRYGYVPMVLITPFPRNGGNGANKVGLTLADYAEAIRTIGAYYGLVVCDMYAQGGVPIGTLSDTGTSNRIFTTDGLHLRKEAGRRFAPKIIEALAYAYNFFQVACGSMGRSAEAYTLTSTDPVQIYVTLTPGVTTEPVVWTSSNEGVVTVEPYADLESNVVKLRAISSGAATVTATCGVVSTNFAVTVSL